MTPQVSIGQKWAAWIPARQQWLLATVVSREQRNITLTCDGSYGLTRANDLRTDEGAMTQNRNLFRFVET